MGPRDEAALVDACRGGQLEAFGDLVRPYQDRLYHTLYRMVGCREDAAELLQDALIQAYRNLGSFHGESSFYTWLYRIGVNLALTRKRRRKLRVVTGGNGGLPLGQLADPVERTEPGRRLEDDERRRQVQVALDNVPELFRVVLVLKEVEGLKYEEIATVLDLPVGTVRSRLHRARTEMRRRLKPLFDEGVL